MVAAGDAASKCQNAWKKVSPALAFSPLYKCVFPALSFRHQGQCGIAGHILIRHSAISYDGGKSVSPQAIDISSAGHRRSK
jgi:hypothetical protein